MSLLDVDFSEKINKAAEESAQLLSSIKAIEDELICEWQKKYEKRDILKCTTLPPFANIKLLVTLVNKKGKKCEYCLDTQIATSWYTHDNDIHRLVHDQFVRILENLRSQGHIIHNIILDNIGNLESI